MSPSRRTAPPTGMNPPRRAEGPGGVDLDLVALAGEVCTRYYEEFSDEDDRYGEAGRAWCQHDNQHLLNWAADAVQGYVDLDREVSWLARVLEARDFPIERLARSLELGGDVVREHVEDGHEIADALAGAGARVRARGTFLD
jgi:hypothetical protein